MTISTNNISTINFGALKNNLGASQLCIIIDTNSIDEMNALAEKLREKNLECLEAKEKNIYAQHFHLEQGIVVYAKKHASNDADHSKGLDLGVTVKKAFEQIKETFRERYQSVRINPQAYENLQSFLQPFNEIGGLGVAQNVMPELEEVQTVLNEVKSHAPQVAMPKPEIQTVLNEEVKPSTETSRRLWYWLTGTFILSTVIYCWRYLGKVLSRTAMAHLMPSHFLLRFHVYTNNFKSWF